MEKKGLELFIGKILTNFFLKKKRLDKDTSGLMIIAKNDKIHILLKDMFSNKQIIKKYVGK